MSSSRQDCVQTRSQARSRPSVAQEPEIDCLTERFESHFSVNRDEEAESDEERIALQEWRSKNLHGYLEPLSNRQMDDINLPLAQSIWSIGRSEGADIILPGSRICEWR